MCKIFTQDYTRCGCRKICHKICRNHIDYTHKQADNSPCPDVTTHALSSVEGLRPGTRNHPGPCPRTHTIYVIQTEEERQADIKDASLWAPSTSTILEPGSGLWQGKPKPKTAKVDIAFGAQAQQAPELSIPLEDSHSTSMDLSKSDDDLKSYSESELKASRMLVDSFDQADYEAWKAKAETGLNMGDAMKVDESENAATRY